MGIEAAIRPYDEACITLDKKNPRDEGVRISEKMRQWQYLLEHREELITEYGMGLYETVKNKIRDSLFSTDDLKY